MKTALSFAVLPFVALMSTGCNQSAQQSGPVASTGGVAVIDLDEVARQLGSDKQIVTAIKQREAALNTKLGDLAKNYMAEFEKHREALAAEKQDQSVQLASYQQQVNKNLSTARAQAQQNLTQHRSKLITQFREAVLPAARRVANGRGMNVILTKQDSLLYAYQPDADITAEVVTTLRASMAKTASATAEQSKQ